MVSHINSTERRNHKRFKLRNNVIATIRPGSINVGNIMDISQSGLSFAYYRKQKPIIEAIEMDILLPDFNKAFFLQKLPIKTIWDILVSKNTPPESSPLRVRGFAFIRLNQTQASNLELIIRSYSERDYSSDHF